MTYRLPDNGFPVLAGIVPGKAGRIAFGAGFPRARGDSLYDR